MAPTTNSQDPPVKKQKRDNKTESSVSENSPPALCDDDDKENQKPLKLKKKETEDVRETSVTVCHQNMSCYICIGAVIFLFSETPLQVIDRTGI